MADACQDCGGRTIVVADAIIQCTSCGRIFDYPVAAEPQIGPEGETPIEIPIPGWQETPFTELSGSPSIESLTPARDANLSSKYLGGHLRKLSMRRDLFIIGGAFVLIGSFIMLFSPFISLVATKALIESDLGHVIGWADILNLVLMSGPGMLICFGMTVSVILSLYGLYMATMMVRGMMSSRMEVFLSALAMGIIGAVISLLTIGGLLGVAGAALIVIGGSITALPV